MNYEALNQWTSTFYSLIHALDIAHKIDFGNQDRLNQSVENARNWITPDCSFESILLDSPEGKGKLKFRREPVKNFTDIASNVAKMLVQDLVVLFDELMTQVLKERSEKAGTFPQSKVEKLSTHLDPKYLWAKQGCLELIAVRNVLCHNQGVWNKKSIDVIDDFIDPLPKTGDKLTIGFTMLFFYRKAIRTFINETKA